jgi:DeoR family fructose operon transcriptional repressor
MELSVITPSLTAAMVLSGKPNIQVMIPGGMLHHINRSILNEESSLTDNYSVDIAFLSCRSFRLPGGTFEHSQNLTNTKRALAKIARTRILLMDHSKWNVNSLCMTIPLKSIDLIITDTGAPMEQVRQAAALGLKIILVDPATREVIR